MITGVAGFLLAVSFLTWAAALAADEGLRRIGWPTRWVWLGALVTPLVLLMVPLLSASAPASAGVPGGVFALPGIVVGEASRDWLAGLLPLVVGGLWAASTAAFSVLLIAAHRELQHARQGWTRAEVGGEDVYVSADHGPAVAGVVRPWIVLPRWALGLPARELDVVVLHEREHVRARDTLVLAGGLFFTALMPWNPFAWLQLRGLKAAMEVDCDRRVLRHAPDRRTYGESLLSVAARSHGRSLGLAAFTEQGRSLERRLRTMTDSRTRWTPLRAALFVGLAAVVAIQACYVDSPVLIFGGDGVEVVQPAEPGSPAVVTVRGAPEPSEPAAEPASGAEPTAPRADEAERARPEPDTRITRPEAPEPTGEPSRPDIVVPPPVVPEQLPVADEEELARRPTFTPFTVAPAILNRSEVVRAMNENYPPLLREAGIGGTVRVYFFVTAEGRVEAFRIDQSSGHPALDDAALRVADVFRFQPALNRDQPVAVWVQFPITFQSK